MLEKFVGRKWGSSNLITYHFAVRDRGFKGPLSRAIGVNMKLVIGVTLSVCMVSLVFLTALTFNVEPSHQKEAHTKYLDQYFALNK
jgi:hypothetical protein